MLLSLLPPLDLLLREVHVALLALKLAVLHHFSFDVFERGLTYRD